jgi:hypothetical protein
MHWWQSWDETRQKSIHQLDVQPESSFKKTSLLLCASSQHMFNTLPFPRVNNNASWFVNIAVYYNVAMRSVETSNFNAVKTRISPVDISYNTMK